MNIIIDMLTKWSVESQTYGTEVAIVENWWVSGAINSSEERSLLTWISLFTHYEYKQSLPRHEKFDEIKWDQIAYLLPPAIDNTATSFKAPTMNIFNDTLQNLTRNGTQWCIRIAGKIVNWNFQIDYLLLAIFSGL